jgi:hypothetical protein
MAADGTLATKFAGNAMPISIYTPATPRTTMTLVTVDYITPSIDSAIAAKIIVQSWRNIAEGQLKEEWFRALTTSFSTGPSRWPALSPRYSAWKAGRKTNLYTKGLKGETKKYPSFYGHQTYTAVAQANLILRTNILQNVMAAREFISVRRAGSPMVTIDIDKEFKSTPYVWLHEFGYGRVPIRSFIMQAHQTVSAVIAGISVSEFVVLDRAMRGDSVVTPRISVVKEPQMGGPQGRTKTPTLASLKSSMAVEKTEVPATFSWGWLGRWFSKPWWWLAPPSSAYLYLGVYSDLKSILTSGVNVSGMVAPFVGAWGLGYSGAMIGVPLTKKTTRRRFRRKVWQRK